jgi:CRISPR-associated endonuclease Csy4
MLTHYLDIHLRPDPEFPAAHLLSALYAKLHRALVLMGGKQIAVCFPEMSHRDVGSQMRLLGPADALDKLMALDWPRGMRDHAQFDELATLHRVQAKSSAERLRRRQMKRHGLSYEQACVRVPEGKGRLLNLPFVQLSSGSSGQKFSLYLQMKPAAAAMEGVFNTYGLSHTATIPWF